MEGKGPGHLALESLLSPLSFVAPYLFVENTNGSLGYILFIFFFFLIFWPSCMACGLLVLLPGIESLSPALEVQSLNHWIARESLLLVF